MGPCGRGAGTNDQVQGPLDTRLGRQAAPDPLLAGYGLLMVVAQLPLLPRYLTLSFSLGTWALTFS
jgi:hypothetical protein